MTRFIQGEPRTQTALFPEQLVSHQFIASEGQALFRYRRPGDISTNTFQLFPLVGFGSELDMQRWLILKAETNCRMCCTLSALQATVGFSEYCATEEEYR